MQNDILKEYIARGTYIFPPAPSMRLITDIFRYCAADVPNWNTIRISGYHIREAGSTAVQEVAFTLANGIEYVQQAHRRRAGRGRLCPAAELSSSTRTTTSWKRSPSSAPRAACGREIMRERFGAEDPDSWQLRFHTQTGGSTLTAQQPENNIVRVTLQALAAVLGGTQSLHTNSMDEALALPTEKAVEIALRTQQIIAYESGVADTVDPLAGSYYIEWLTDEIERQAADYIARIDELGGALRRHRGGLHPARDPGRGLSHAARHREGRAGRRRRQPVPDRARRATADLLRVDESVRTAQMAALATICAPRATTRAVQVALPAHRSRPHASRRPPLMPLDRGGGGSLCHPGRDQ